ncbi:DNA methyltransferase [Bacteroides hominis]|uniref:DNA methyltransferase n=1 Tax=Bacteroides hominis TaxID=2763023 RepID=UPI001D0EFE4F|nr:site-specific DNA-methyltransferase [Bacteroides hominis (ex Afrizal et al. 2022)]MCC2233129.1 site-specific DNA-methyltransferase [Bacteroides hominis (ex Afrizal et al. 2022)]
MNNLNLFQELEKLLRMESRYCSENGELLKNLIVESALALRPDLIRLLLTHEGLKKNFFSDVEGMLVFDKVKFQKFVMNKRFLPDSYTSFKNKIGLTSEDGDFLAESREVVLSWPYKDCVLEGGQTKEDAKRNEVFWNEILAPDEINRLIEPKVLTNFAKYDIDGKHEVSEVSEKDNLIIQGNNLLALHSLLKKYRGKIKLIYIDPPYFFNKITATDAFKYNSNFHMSTWLVFMRNRLEIAKQLLAVGGTIWINISEDGMHYLKILADDIFDKETFVGTIPRRTRNGKSDVPFNFSQDFDWLLCYTNVSNENKIFGRSVKRKYYESDDYPGRPWRLADLTKQTTAKERPNSFFTMIDPKTGKQYPASEKRTWAVSMDTFDYYYNIGYIVFPDDYDFLSISKPYARKFKDEDEKSGKMSAVISDFLIPDFLDAVLNNSKNKDGNIEIDNLLGRDEFDYAKPENLIKAILEVATEEGDLVLDYHLGSGTTAAVAHKMRRQYIGIEQMDYIETVAVERLRKVIGTKNKSGMSDTIECDQGGISKVVDWKGGGSFVYFELAKANQQFADQIIATDTKEELAAIWDTMQQTGFLSWKVDIRAIAENVTDFAALSIKDTKRFLIECLDKNLLYVPLSEIDNIEFGISDTDKKLNTQFYRKK